MSSPNLWSKRRRRSRGQSRNPSPSRKSPDRLPSKSTLSQRPPKKSQPNLRRRLQVPRWRNRRRHRPRSRGRPPPRVPFARRYHHPPVGSYRRHCGYGWKIRVPGRRHPRRPDARSSCARRRRHSRRRLPQEISAGHQRRGPQRPPRPARRPVRRNDLRRCRRGRVRSADHVRSRRSQCARRRRCPVPECRGTGLRRRDRRPRGQAVRGVTTLHVSRQRWWRRPRRRRLRARSRLRKA
jgi:hypothetical protein